MDVANSTTLTNSQFVATDSITMNTGDTTLDGSVLYSENTAITLETDDLSANDVIIL